MSQADAEQFAKRTKRPMNGWWQFALLAAIGGITLAILFAPTPEDLPPTAQRLAAMTVMMGLLWMTQAIPISVTSLIPIAAYPLLGIQAAKVVSKAYMDHVILLYFTGFIIAIGIERWGLHKRMALGCIYAMGTSPGKLMLGFMIATALMSMWISNTASTLLMLPIGVALLQSLRDDKSAGTISASSARQHALFSGMFVLSIAYAANIGGMSTLVGTPTNIAYVGFWSNGNLAQKHPEAANVSPGEWMFVFVPLAIVMLLMTWRLLLIPVGRVSRGQNVTRAMIARRLRELGNPAWGEIAMAIIFVSTALLWVFRSPIRFGSTDLIPGWSSWVVAWSDRINPNIELRTSDIHDSTVGMLMVLLMFLVRAPRGEQQTWQPLMDWDTIQERIPWGILLLFGGGFAIAGAFQQTGLAEWVGVRFADLLEGQSSIVLVLGICLLMTFLTEFTSNVATVNTLLPVLYGASMQLGIDPRLLMIPATISASCAFMLPIATPPNAIVFGSGLIPMSRMIRYGIIVNLIGVALITTVTFVLLRPIFQIA